MGKSLGIYFKLAWRGLRQIQKTKRHLTLVLGCSSFLLFLFLSIFSTLETNQKNYWGKILVGTNTFYQAEVVQYDIVRAPDPTSYFSLSKSSNQLPNINSGVMAPRLRTSAYLEGYDGGNTNLTLLIGMDPKQESHLTPAVYLVRGRLPQMGEREICFFSKLAGLLNVDVGDQVIIYGDTIEGYANFDLLKVTGILGYDGVQTFTQDYLFSYAPLDFVQEFKGVNQDVVSELAIRSKSFKDRLVLHKAKQEPFTVIPWHKSNTIATSLHLGLNFFKTLILILIGAIVASSVYHNVRLMVEERKREIGVYLVNGALKSWLIGLLCLELTLYTLYCALWGVIYTLPCIWLINNLGIYATSDVLNLILGVDVFTLTLKINAVSQGITLILLIVLLAALKPFFAGINEDGITRLLTR